MLELFEVMAVMQDPVDRLPDVGLDAARDLLLKRLAAIDIVECRSDVV